MQQQSLSKTLALSGAVAAVVLAATMVGIHVPAFRLSFNLGEAAIYTAALLWGRKIAGPAGGIGAAIADLLSGSAVWAPITFVVKSLEGYLAGSLAERAIASQRRPGWTSLAPAAAVMVVSYSLAAWLLYGKAAVFVEFPGDLLQVSLGGAIALTVARLAQPGGTAR